MFFLGNKKRNDVIMNRIGEFNKKISNPTKPQSSSHSAMCISYSANLLKVNDKDITNSQITLKFNNKR